MKTITRKMVIPDWSNWIAQDCLGYWWVFEYVPTLDGEGGWNSPDGESSHIYDGKLNKNWERTLSRI